MKPIAPYGIVGGGRAARHFARYLRLSQLPFLAWKRTDKTPPETKLRNCKVILLLINDGAIEPFIKSNPFLRGKTLVHFSGSLSTPLASGMHPLISFGAAPLTLAQYRKIPFITERGRAGFGKIFPALKNPVYRISPEARPYYHALCVLAGNFSTALWQKMFRDIERRTGVPASAAKPYLRSVFRNIAHDGARALTGPFARGDSATVGKNLAALCGDPYLHIYKSFAKVLGKEVPCK